MAQYGKRNAWNYMKTIQDIVRDKNVALVGNSQSILETTLGPEIDRHDEVIRINLGLPDWRMPPKDFKSPTIRIRRDSVGYRTTLWATARYWPNVVPADCKLIVWMKLTKLGQFELQSLWDSQPHCPIIQWTQDLEDEVEEFVGAPPGTGIRLLYYLKKYCSPKSLSVYGMDCWETKTHWSGKGPTPNHSPSLEKLAMAKLGF